MKRFFIALPLFAILALACNTSTLFATPTPEPTPTPVPVGADLSIPLPPGDPTRGELLFNGPFACAACHGVFEGQVTTCPNLFGLSARAATRVSGYPAEMYLREAIVSPNAYVVEGYTEGVMPQNFAETMSAQQLADVLAFLMTK
ncbi:MAG: c-type cytochrome [Anaerolineales bacterium]|nr:c-type cytochrome [Anaerolineales bacterium]